MTPTDFKNIVETEINSLLKEMEGETHGPEEQEFLTRTTRNMAMLPIWMAQGADVDTLINDMKAEGMLRGVTLTLKAQSRAQQAWFNIITKIIATSIGLALT